MNLGELINALQDYQLHTVGVDDDTDVEVTFPDHQATGEVDDVKVTITRSQKPWGGSQISATVVLEVRSL